MNKKLIALFLMCSILVSSTSAFATTSSKGAYYSSIWMSAVKKTYYCSQYNRTWKVGMGYVTAVYADRNWSDYIKTFTIRGF